MTGPERPNASGKSRLRDLMYRVADERGHVPLSSSELAGALGLGIHETVHLIWSLQKEGTVVRLREFNRMRGEIVDIKVKKKKR